MPVEFPGRRDGQPDAWAGARRADVVVVTGRREHEVTGARAHRRGVPFDLPVDLALHHDPPLVGEVIVTVGGVTGWLADQRADDLIVDDELLHPRCGSL